MTRIKLPGINCLFFGVCFIIIIIFSILLYSEYTEMFAYEGSEKTGIIIYKDKITQRRPNSEVIWEDIKKESRIFEGDTVRTGEDSSAVVSLINGTRITMSANSMIRFLAAKDNLNIGFLKGVVSAKGSGTAENGAKAGMIKIGENYIPVGDNIQVSESGKNIDISMSGGNGVILSKDRKYSVKDNERIVVDSTGEIKIKPAAVKLLMPEYDKFFITYSVAKEILFSWETGSKKNTLEISYDIEFNSVAARKETSGNSEAVKLKPGTYYWRLKSSDRSKGNVSAIWKFRIIKDAPVRLYSPFNGRKFSYVNKPPMIDFRWDDNALSLKYVLEISDDNKFQHIIKSVQTGENYISSDIPGAGTYFWRVKSKTGFDEDETPEFIIHKFVVLKTDIFNDIALLTPRNNSIIADDQAGKNPVFSCREDNEIDRYQLIVSDRKNPGTFVYSAVSKNNFIIPDKALPEGEFLWKIEGISVENGVVSKSATRNLRIISSGALRIISPLKGAITVAAENSNFTKVMFSWDSGIPEAAYLIRLYDDEKMNNLLKEETVNTGSVIIDKLQPGSYYWHVYLLDVYKNKIIVSENSSFTVKKSLHAPVVIGPRNSSVIDILKKNYIEFAWSAAEEANLYTLSLYRIEDNNETKLWEKEIKDTDIIIDNIREYGKGNYAWTLQAFEKDAGNKIIRRSRILRNNFTLTRKILEKPTIEKLEIR